MSFKSRFMSFCARFTSARRYRPSDCRSTPSSAQKRVSGDGSIMCYETNSAFNKAPRGDGKVNNVFLGFRQKLSCQAEWKKTSFVRWSYFEIVWAGRFEFEDLPSQLLNSPFLARHHHNSIPYNVVQVTDVRRPFCTFRDVGDVNNKCDASIKV